MIPQFRPRGVLRHWLRVEHDWLYVGVALLVLTTILILSLAGMAEKQSGHGGENGIVKAAP
jgi:hypothetical protein